MVIAARFAARMLGGGHGEEVPGPPTPEVTNGKIALLVILGPLTLLASAAPFCAQRIFKKNSLNVINFLSAVAAGFVFGAFAMHSIPESSQMFHEYLEPRYKPLCLPVTHADESHRARLLEETLHAEDPTTVCGKESFVPDYPWALLVASLTWLLLVLLDRSIVAHGLEGGGGDHHSHDHVSQAFIQMQVEKEREEGARGGVKEEEGGPDTAKGTPPEVVLKVTPSGAVTLRSISSSTPLEIAYDMVASSVNHAHCTHHSAAGEVPVGASKELKAAAQLAEENARKDSFLRACVFLVALSIHSVFDGLGVGVATTMEDFASVAVAVVAHKAFDGIALGVPVYLARLTPFQTWGSLTFCALMTPMGIAIGWGVREAVKESGNLLLAEAIIISITAGSFLYISASELLPSSLHDGKFVGGKILCFAAGFGAMAVLAGYV